MADNLEIWTEADDHIIDDNDDFGSSDNFMGNAEDERSIREAMQNDAGMPDGFKDSLNDAELASQYQVLETGSETGDSETAEEIEAMLREEEREAIMRDAARCEAALEGREDEFLENQRSCAVISLDEDEIEEIMFNAYRESFFMDWDTWLAQVGTKVKAWSAGSRDFDRSEFSAAILEFMLKELKSEAISEKFAGKLADGVFGTDRKLLGMDENLWNEFIDGLCVFRLDLMRQDWDSFVKSQTRHWLATVSWDSDFRSEGYDLKVFRDEILSDLKTSDLKCRFNAQVSYDPEKDALEIICDESLVVKALDEFLVEVNRLKPEYLKEKEEKEIQKAIEKAIEEQKRLEREAAERKPREERERLERAEAERKEREKAE